MPADEAPSPIEAGGSSKVSPSPAGRLTLAAGRTVRNSSFALVANGFADGPAQAMRDYLVKVGVRRVVAVNHPLSREEGSLHLLKEWIEGRPTKTRSVHLPSRPPLTYPLDVFAPLLLPPVDVWFGFNPLNVMQGIATRHLRRAGCVVYWGVDFVEERFGGGPLTSIYERIEGFACRRSDARFELSPAMRDARDDRHLRPGRRLAPARVVPMGAWTGLVPKCPPDAYTKRTIIYMGHLLPKQGLVELLEAVHLLKERNIQTKVEIIGRGPQEADLRKNANRLGIDRDIRFHGFIEDHRELERMVAAGSIGAAPYATGSASSYTVFADPGKLKIYMAAGLPIITTTAAPVATELAEAGAAIIVDFNPPAIAAAIERLLKSPEEWQRRRAAALRVSTHYDWDVILAGALDWLGFD